MLLELFGILSAIPIGYFLAWLAREELVVGRKWFQRLVILSLVLGGTFWAYGLREGLEIGCFLAILAFIAYHQSFNRRWTKSKI
ncbi:hypothetical protein FJZ22_00135 [Candidatus Pacearchaeota archaeon]|nr:hypothetical protein [Candidatus Pacearchaeota archaeon]